ncbi:MAG: hypothetical protein ACXVH0_04235 [Thermoanaerobaculia bacterium]
MSVAAAAYKQEWKFPQRIAARLTGSPWFWALFVAAAFALPLVRSVRRALPPAPPVLGSFPAFSLVDQAGNSVGEADLRGHLVVAEFTTAAALVEGGSPLAKLQRRVRNTGEAVHLISFVDMPSPSSASSTPAEGPTLAALAKGAGAGAWRWTLAGGDVRLLEAATLKALHAPEGGTLAGRLLLVDARGRVRRLAAPTPDEIDRLMRDLGLLGNMEGL